MIYSASYYMYFYYYFFRPGDITTNRGNELLKKVLKRRYPNIISDEVLTEWLSKTGSEQSKFLNYY